MQAASAQCADGMGDKIAATDQEGERRRDDDDHLEDAGEGEVGRHAEVARQGEGHCVHGERTADAEPKGEAGGARSALLIRPGADRVAKFL